MLNTLCCLSLFLWQIYFTMVGRFVDSLVSNENEPRYPLRQAFLVILASLLPTRGQAWASSQDISLNYTFLLWSLSLQSSEAFHWKETKTLAAVSVVPNMSPWYLELRFYISESSTQLLQSHSAIKNRLSIKGSSGPPVPQKMTEEKEYRYL